MNLIEFLNARLDEDEAAARAVTFRSRFTAIGNSVQSPAGIGHPAMPIADVIDPETAAHIARHDPARVLREVEAKRQLLRQFELRGNSVRATVKPPTGGVWDDLLRILALPYADHPDYRAASS